MPIRAVVFDIGGVLEFTPPLGITEKWEQKLGLEPGELDKRLHDVWRGGSIGTITLEQVHTGISEIMGMSAEQVNAMMEDTWVEYLGTLNVELAEYFARLHGLYKTAIISNSFVGAREREQATYHFGEMTDFIIYSHEVGIRKPDVRIFEMALQRLDVQPAEMIFVDDHADVFASAVELGIHCIEFKDTPQTIADIEACIKANA